MKPAKDVGGGAAMASRPKGGNVVAESCILLHRPWEYTGTQENRLFQIHLVCAGAIAQYRQPELVIPSVPGRQPLFHDSPVHVAILGGGGPWPELPLGKFWSVAQAKRAASLFVPDSPLVFMGPLPAPGLAELLHPGVISLLGPPLT